MKNLTLAIATFALLLAAAPAAADLIALQPNPADLYDLDHGRYYTWGFTPTFDETDPVVTAATLSFDNIRNWNDRPNQLYVHLLDHAPAGVRTYYDGSGDGDNLAGQGILLNTWVNLPSDSQDIDYDFTTDQVVTLNQYLQNGSDLGMGFDPDCHFYNRGVTLTLEYGSEVPEPASLSLIITGAVLVLIRKKSRRLV